jgi:hypothetical protein
MNTFGSSNDISLIFALLIFGVVWLLLFIAYIWLGVQGFRVHWGWGVANLLIPWAAIIFCFLHFEKSRKPVGLIIIAFALLLFLWIFTKL